MNSQALHLSYQNTLSQLYSRIDYERNTQIPDGMRGWKLERMGQFLQRLGRPDRKLTIVHVAGTKGKGSTVAMVGSILAQAGYKTGVYTSPHLEVLEERIAINGVPCSEAELVDLFRTVWPVVEQMDGEAKSLGWPGGATFFEITTAMALLHFARVGTQAVVLEVGLGGRLDSTNVCQPVISVITSISYDHTKQLGNTLELIAAEKAGIIKPGIPVISGVRQSGPREVIERIARDNGAPLSTIGNEFQSEIVPLASEPRSHDGRMLKGRSLIHYHEGGYSFRDVEIGLIGNHQAANATLAIAVVRRLVEHGLSVSERAIRAGLSTVRCPARIEVISQAPRIILDVAHNVAAVTALIDALNESFKARRRTLLFAASRDKDVEKMLRLLVPQFDSLILTQFVNNPRSSEPERLADLARSILGANPDRLTGPEIHVCPDPQSAWLKARASVRSDELLCVTGSFFLVAEIMPLVRSHPFGESTACF